MMKNDMESYLRDHVRPIDTSGRYEQRLRATLAGLPERGRIGFGRQNAGFGMRRGWRVAVVAAALCALSAGSVAYSLSRGVLNFNEDFGWGTPIVSQEGAQALVTAGELAHVSFAHVDVDVLEAVCDGAELRVVYSVTNRDGESVERDGTVLIVPGAEEDGVHICDFISVNGQDAFFDATYEAEGAPGQVLYYLQTNLASWGVDVSGAEELTVGLPLMPRESDDCMSPTLDFAISAGIPEGMVREAALAGETEGVTVVKSSFSPVQGYVELQLDGVLADRVPTGMCRASAAGVANAADGTEMECHVVFLRNDDGGARVGIAMMPPEGAWPERMTLTVEMCAPDEDLNVEMAIPAR